MTQGIGYVKGLFIGSLFGGLMGAFAASFYASKSGKALRKDIKNKITNVKIKAADSTVSSVKDDNALQIKIMSTAHIPKEEMHNYALSSVADGRILREYINEVKSGEITTEEAVIKVKKDYDKMKSGKKDGKFVSPSKADKNDIPELHKTKSWS